MGIAALAKEENVGTIKRNKTKIIGLLMSTLIVFGGFGTQASGQGIEGIPEDQQEGFAYTNISTGAFIIVFRVDAGDVANEYFDTLKIDGPFAEDALENTKSIRFTGESDCIAYTGIMDFSDGPEKVTVVACQESNEVSIFIANGSLRKRSLFKFVDSFVLDEDLEIPTGYIDVSSIVGN